VSRPDGS